MNPEILDIVKDARRLEVLANEACEVAEKNKENFSNDPINWARVRCTDTACGYDMEGNYVGYVTISYASPSCGNFCLFIGDYIKENWPVVVHPIICVTTEW